MAGMMHVLDETLTHEENLKRCGERVELMRAIAARLDDEGFMVHRIAGAEPGPIGMLFPTIRILFRDREVFELHGEAELFKTIMALVGEISDLYVQFEMRHWATQNIVQHVLLARKMVPASWLDRAAELVNDYMEISCVGERPQEEAFRLGDKIAFQKATRIETAVPGAES